MPSTDTVRAFLSDRHAEIAREVTEFARSAIATLPAPADDEASRLQAREILAIIGDAGWFGYAVPKAFGGKEDEPDLRACCLIREALAAASPLADAVFALQALGSMPITLMGSDSLKAEWLPKVANGKAMAAFAMTEPGAGSDVSNMATGATISDSQVLIDGRKIFISNAGIADFYTTFAATDPSRGTRGISCFVVPADSPGFRFVEPQLLSSPHPLGVIKYDECIISKDNLLGDEGQGFKLGMMTLDRLRPTVAAAACGMAERAMEEATTHALGRQQFGNPLSDFQLIQEKLAIMAIDLAASRLLVYRAAWEKDGGKERITMEAAMAKAFATEAAQRIIDQSLQILGGKGALASNPVERLYRSIRALRIYEGTTEIQHLIIARHLLEEANG